MVYIDNTRCNGCGLCVSDCVIGNLNLEDGKSVVKSPCFHCGHCVAICPTGAASISEYQMDEVEEYQKDSFDLSPEVFLHAVKFRRSIRCYQDKKIEQEKLRRIAAAGVYTETAVNSQGVRFIMIQDQLDKLKSLSWEGWLAYASQEGTLVSPHSDKIRGFYEAVKENPRKDRLFFNAPAAVIVASNVPLDGGLASANMEMMATAEGLGMMFNGYLVRALNHSPEALKWLGIEDCPIVSAMLIGYPGIMYQRTAPRKKGNVVLL